MVKGLLYHFLFKAVMMVLIALVLYGIFPGTALVVILLLMVGVRLTALVSEALRRKRPAPNWETAQFDLARTYHQLTVEERARRAAAFNLDQRLSADELAQAQIDQARRNYSPPRSIRELFAEALGVVAFAILLPLVIALYTRDIFSIGTSQGWAGAVVAAVCLGIYFYPHFAMKSPELSELRILWWVLPFAVGLGLLNHVVNTRHPYLNPFNPERTRLAAERVLSLRNNITAGAHADWVLRYARELDERGEVQPAIHYYHEGLRLDPTQRAAFQRLAILEAKAAGVPADAGASTARPSMAPYWTAEQPVTKPPRQRIGPELASVSSCTVVIVPMGDVPNQVLDSAGYVIQHELGLPVCVSPDRVPLPPYTRKRGLLADGQWNTDSLVQAFTNATRVFPNAPIKYVLITPADIYIDEANYVFSATYPWGVLLSSARFGWPNGSLEVIRQRTAKQALCALIKSFGVPASTDRDCVTSYSDSLQAFDAKGNRPNAETLKLFRQAVDQTNQRWQQYKARSALH